MGRIPLIGADDELDQDRRSAVERIVASRGELSRPFQILLHSPAMARAVAELGHLVRFGSGLSDTDRELVTLATGRALGCAFVWESHLEGAVAAGVGSETITALERDRHGLAGRDGVLLAFVDELCATGQVPDETFAAVVEALGVRETVELALTVGYYTMLARVLGACGAC